MNSIVTKWPLRLVFGLLTLAVVLLIGVRLLYGGGKPYPDISTEPSVAAERVSAPIRLPYPPGMVASTPDGRIFYTYHMLHKPERFSQDMLFEWKGGEAVPWPSEEMQPEFYGAMGIVADTQGRLWMVKPGALAGQQTRLMAIDMASGELVVDHLFEEGIAGSAQDLRVSPDGNTVYLADTGLLKFIPASLVVFDVPSGTARKVLEGHPSVSPQDWVMHKSNGKPNKIAFGLVTFVVGVDGIALSADGDWLYYATMTHDSAYRVPTSSLLDASLSDDAIATSIEFVGYKPMSDGIELLPDNTLIITDVENGGLAALSPDGKLETLTKSSEVDWADSVTIAADGSIWFTDSRLGDQLNQLMAPANETSINERGPYAIYQIGPGTTEASPASE